MAHPVKRLALALLVAGIPAEGFAQQAVQHVFLIQNSGWMEPYLTDSKSPLRPLTKALAASVGEGRVVVASFNQDGQVSGRRSPHVLFEGKYSEAAVGEAIEAIDLPRKASGAYADADFSGALIGAIKEGLRGAPGVIWMVTNNRNSPSNSAEVVANTQRFYDELRRSPHITRIFAMPLRAEVAGKNFRESGFIIYAIAYGKSAGEALDQAFSTASRARSIFKSPPVRLKPLDQDTLWFQLTGAEGPVEASRRGNGMLLDAIPGDEPARIVLHGRLINRLYPQVIKSADVTARLRVSDPVLAGAKVTLNPSRIEAIPAGGESKPIAITVDLPPIERSEPFAERRRIDGELALSLRNTQLALDPQFVARMSSVGTGGAAPSANLAAVQRALPELFSDYEQVRESSARFPLALRARYSNLPLILLGMAGLIAIAGLAYMLTRHPEHMIDIGGERRRVRIKGNEVRTVVNSAGIEAEVRGRYFGAPRVRLLDNSAQR